MRNDMTRLGDLCEFRYGKSLPEPTRRPGRVPVYGSNGIVGTHDEALTESEAIIIGRKGSIGEVHLSDQDCWPIDTTYYVDRSASEVDLPWLSRALRSLRLADLNKAAAVPGLNRSDAYDLKLFVPRVDEQRRIAAILDKADALRRQRKRARLLRSEFERSVFEQFNNNKTGAWRTLQFAELALAGSGNFGNGPFGSDLLTSELKSEGVPVVYIRDIVSGQYIRVSKVFVSSEKARQLSSSRVQPGDVLIAKVGDPPGTAAVYPHSEPNGIMTQDVVRLRVDPKIVVPEYLTFFINSGVGQHLISRIEVAATRSRFSLRDFKNLPVDLPPVPTQNKFLAILRESYSISEKQAETARMSDTLFASLQHRAFSGQL